ncbi:MAG: hypothetical protein ACPG4T_18605, partial [Nannocystaceae bacterium]
MTRRPPTILRGRLRAFAVRAIATMQVALGFGVEPAMAEPVVAPGASPALAPEVLAEYYRRLSGPSLGVKQRRALARLLYDPEGGRSPGQLAVAIGYPVPPALGRLLTAPGKATDQNLLATLDEVERTALVDNWIVAFLWGQLAHIPEPVDQASRERRRLLLARLHTHARLAGALVRARSEVGKIVFTPWRSKAAPPRGYREGPSALEVAAVVHRHLQNTDTGTWETSSTLALEVLSGESGLRLVRAGKVQAPGSTFRLGRLDLLETTAPVVVEHKLLGAITLPVGRQISVWQLPTFVTGQA